MRVQETISLRKVYPLNGMIGVVCGTGNLIGLGTAGEYLYSAKRKEAHTPREKNILRVPMKVLNSARPS